MMKDKDIELGYKGKVFRRVNIIWNEAECIRTFGCKRKINFVFVISAKNAIMCEMAISPSIASVADHSGLSNLLSEGSQTRMLNKRVAQ